ncbi:8-amino-7-oxononanoate synthase [Glaesserella parasuis]|uniref:Putative 8-amino-7-oxononanoate synthase n=3 Tax=Glaesserella parasuis TaxID=738 RepID=BIOF_GLAP5|nr:8-amino-7-oxononanoate synthase [Glaesserella parasuis]B8F713.1 RecName: Full=Putative 8-amino-7-oxononanoate synthase; Short=AONS; AltName: Full=7-keto-8-amino-pelargonic acid synthase; Short=7-KAP synthase; AltName: Full=8-amino-7-ketopelargonate synthase [Glaesserella parasuis SH0165]AGO17194.1 8-amino-7-oxononanoate synthase [Glaesserella parasuis ZJ0906]ACL33115.1 8-amino-7-oxononanoate synthase [Glaesserella parasuis SH0165]AWY46618.1 8-amino-7-oxononanoate synthase [Glaesserella paras
MNKFTQHLQQLAEIGQKRQLPDIEHQGKFVIARDLTMLNLSSNDYLGLANDAQQVERFLQSIGKNQPLTSSSSRLLTGNFPIYQDFETLLAQRFQRESALLFNSGYHANIGILPAVADKQTLILADKLAHASLIDGIRLSGADFFRYKHNDYLHLEQLLQTHSERYQQVIIVTESVFSMDGDIADLQQLVALKKRYTNVLLYVDEAHAIGVYGQQGLGMAEVFDCIQEIDFLVGTFGKALASMGAYLVCDSEIREYLINTMRPLIFSTALPPINVAWTYFLFEQLPQFTEKRHHLEKLSQILRTEVTKRSEFPLLSETCIVPYILGENQQAVEKADYLQKQGYYCLPIRPPTVPKGTARLRFSLTADLTEQDIMGLISCL